jgi:hypothetical protein
MRRPQGVFTGSLTSPCYNCGVCQTALIHRLVTSQDMSTRLPSKIEEHAARVLRFLQAGDEHTVTNGILGSTLGRWDLIDEQLSQWIADPGALADDDLEPPTVEILQQGVELAHLLRDLGAVAPLRLVSTGDSGIMFEFQSLSHFDTVEVGVDGIELVRFVDARVVRREQFATGN